jgi:hypothetical protein
MYFELEQPVCETTGKPCENIFVCRGYRQKGMAKYFCQSTVIQRKNGLWEPTAWVTDRPPRGYHIEGMRFLLGRFGRISGTFETRLLRAYRRMFRGHYELVELETKVKEYNGRDISFTYVEFKKEK